MKKLVILDTGVNAISEFKYWKQNLILNNINIYIVLIILINYFLQRPGEKRLNLTTFLWILSFNILVLGLKNICIIKIKSLRNFMMHCSQVQFFTEVTFTIFAPNQKTATLVSKSYLAKPVFTLYFTAVTTSPFY